MKRAISLVLSVMLVISMFASLNVSVYAEESTVQNTTFPYNNADTYVADSIIRGVIDKEGVAHGSSETSLALLHNYAYRNIAEELVDDGALMFDSLFWQNLKSTLSGDFVNITNWQEEMYILLIIDYLNYYSESAEFESNYLKNTFKFTENIYKNVIKYADSEYLDNVDEIIKNQSLSDAVAFSNKWGIVDDLKKYNSILGDIETVSSTAADYYKNLTKALSVQKADESRIEFLKQMKKAGSDNYYFVTAVDNVISMYESSYGSLAFSQGAKTMLKHGMSVLFSEAKKACPEAAAIIDGLKIYNEGLNWLFNSDDISKNNLKLVIVYTIGSYASSAVRSLRDVFQANLTEDNASAFINGYLGYLKYQEYASNNTIGFVSSALFDGAVNQIINCFSDKNTLTYNEFKEYFHNDISFCESLEKLVQKHYDFYYAILGYDPSAITDDDPQDNLTEVDPNTATCDDTDFSDILYQLMISGNTIISKNYTLTNNLTIYGDLYFKGGTLDLNGHTLSVGGNVIQSGGTIDINRGVLEVAEDYRIQTYKYDESLEEMVFTTSTGCIEMNQASDRVKIGGDFIVQTDKGSYVSTNTFTAGVLEIKGDVKQINGNSSNFNCSKNHTVILNGDKNVQKISFDSTSSHFSNLKLTKDKDTGYIFNPDNCWNNLYLDTDVKSVSIISDLTSLRPMDIYTLYAKVEGINKPSQEVVWQLTGNTDNDTTIDNYGIVTIGEDEKSEKITITATSVADNSKSATLELSIVRPTPVVIGVRINPTVVSVVNGETCQFEAVTYGLYKPAQGVTWSMSGNTSANTSINSDGLLTIAEDETTEKLTVTATSIVDPTKSASVTVDIYQIKIISTVSNVTVTMVTGETQKFQAVVTGSNNPNQKVIWTVGGNESTNTIINENGELTVGEDETAKTIIVRATSVDSPEKYGEFAINITNSDEPQLLIGDTNLDGKITISDVTAIQRHIAELEQFTDEQLVLADTNGDGEINIIDATHLQKYLAEFEGIVLGKQTV